MLDAVDELLGVDRAREKAAGDPLELGVRFVARVGGGADEQDLDRSAAGRELHAIHRLERAGCIRIADDERRSLHGDTPREQSERNVDHPIAAAA